MAILETERLILRPWAIEDAEELFQLAKDEHVGPPCGWSPHKDVEESKYVLTNILINDYTFAIILKGNNEIIGDIGLCPWVYVDIVKMRHRLKLAIGLGMSTGEMGICRKLVPKSLNTVLMICS